MSAKPWDSVAAAIAKLSARLDSTPTVREATLTSHTTVRYDTDDHDTIVRGNLANQDALVGSRVLTLTLRHYVWVLGVKGGVNPPPPPPPDTFVSSTALVGDGYDGVSPLTTYTYHGVVNRNASGHGRWTFPEPFKNGFLYGNVQIVEGGNNILAFVKHSGGVPASYLNSMGIDFRTSTGGATGTGLIRFTAIAVGW